MRHKISKQLSATIITQDSRTEVYVPFILYNILQHYNPEK